MGLVMSNVGPSLVVIIRITVAVVILSYMDILTFVVDEVCMAGGYIRIRTKRHTARPRDEVGILLKICKRSNH